MKRLLLIALTASAIPSAFAFDLVVNNRVMDIFDPMYDRVDEFGVLDPNGQQVNYHVLDFYVTQSGLYDLEMAVRSANEARDTYLFLYDTALDPNDATINFLAGNDDNSDDLSVLSGSYHTSFEGRSRINQFSLTANHQYQAVLTSYDFSATFFQEMTYDVGIGNGVGNVIQGSPVPEPASLLVLGAGAAALLRRRSRK